MPTLLERYDHPATSPLRLIHITDCHLLNTPHENHHGINTRISLENTLTVAKKNHPHHDLILFTGDISQTGTQQSYALFQSIIQTTTCPVYCVPGNHDLPIYLHQIIPSCPVNRLNAIELGDFHLLLLNSWVPNQHHGQISSVCLAQLDAHLQAYPNKMFIIAVHHPPVDTHCKWLDKLGLINRQDMLSILHTHKKNILLLFGHVHQALAQRTRQLNLLATPSSCYQFPTHTDFTQGHYHANPAYRYLEIHNNGTIQTEVCFINANIIAA